MIHLDRTTDTILKGKITITQMKHGYRYGFDAVCLAAFVNGYLRKNKKLNVTIEGHADERGTREYNLALGERRANAARDYLMTYGISGKRISVISYGKEKPVNPAGTPLAWSQKRRSVTVKVN